jgi:hypothetical protein
MKQRVHQLENNVIVKSWVFLAGIDIDDPAVAKYKLPGFDYILETEATRRGSPGYVWHPERGYFTEPAPFPSWSLDENNEWQAPTPKPATGDWDWNEDTQTWDPIIQFIDVNSATETELQALNGVGPSTAAAIILERNENGLFTSLLNLSVRVDGVSAAMADGWTNACIGETA